MITRAANSAAASTQQQKGRVVALWITVGVVLCTILFFYPSAETAKPPTLMAHSSTSAPAHVDLDARIDSATISGKGGAVKLTVVISNHSPAAIEHPALIIAAPELLIAPPAPTDEPDIAAGASHIDTFALTSEVRSGVHPIGISAAWTAGPPAPAPITVGPVTVNSFFGQDKWARLGRRLSQLVKDLTLPLLLFYLTYRYNAKQKEQEDRRARREKKLDTRRANREKKLEILRSKEQDKRAETQRVQQLLLEKVLDLAQQHYLPFVTHARLILLEAGKIQSSATDASPQKLFFHMLLLLRRMDVFRTTKGGIFFQTRNGEKAAGAAWFLIKDSTYSALGEDKVAAALKLVNIRWDYATYLAQFTALAPAWTEFTTWLAEPLESTKVHGSFWQMIHVIDAFQAVMLFEADKALSMYWYEEESTLAFSHPAPGILYQLKTSNEYAIRQSTELFTQLNGTYHRETLMKQLPSPGPAPDTVLQ